LLLLLLEVIEVLVERVLIELGAEGLLGVEVGGVEHGSPLSSVLIGEGLSLYSNVLLLLDPFLLLYHTLLVVKDGLVPGLLPREGGVLHYGLQLNLLWSLVVGGEAGAVVGGVLHRHQLPRLVEVPVHSFDVSFDVSGLHFKGAIRSLITDSIASILIDVVDLLDDYVRMLCSGGIWLLCGWGAGCCFSLLLGG